jgi:mRNA interferase HicA
MKYSEIHRLIRQNGWIYSHAKGSHFFYRKDGNLSPPVPWHGSKEIGEGLKNKIFKELKLKQDG